MPQKGTQQTEPAVSLACCLAAGAELKAFLKRQHSDVSAADAAQLLERLDYDGDGSVTPAECVGPLLCLIVFC